MKIDLQAELERLALGVGDASLVLRRLTGLGVSYATLAALGSRHFSFGIGRVLPVDDGLFVPSGEGRPQLVLPVYEDGELVDLVAFATDKPHDTRLRLGQGWALGLEDGLERYRWGDVLTLHSSPLDWMRAGCVGLCVVDWDAPELVALDTLQRIHCTDARLAPLLRDALRRPYRLPTITTDQELRNVA